MSGDGRNGREGEKPDLTKYVSLAERVIYYGAAVLLIAAIALLFISTVRAFLEIGQTDLLEVTLVVLDQVLLIFIFVELLNTIGVVIREREIVAEPFILIGLIAVVRRILGVTVDIEQSLDDSAEFRNLILELGVLTVLVVALAGALYFTRRVSDGSFRSGRDDVSG